MSLASDSRYGIRYLAHVYLTTHPVDWKALSEYLRDLLTRNNRKYYKEIICNSDGVLIQVESRKMLFTHHPPLIVDPRCWVIVVDPSVHDSTVPYIRSGGEIPIWGVTRPYDKEGLPPEPTHLSLTTHTPNTWQRAIWGLIGLHVWHSDTKWVVNRSSGAKVSCDLTKLRVPHTLTYGTGWVSLECYGSHFSILKVRGPRGGVSTPSWGASAESLKAYHQLNALGPLQVVTNTETPFPFLCKPKPPKPVDKTMLLYPCTLRDLKAVEWP